MFEGAGDPNRIFGWIAVTLSLIYKFPQIIKLHTTKSVAGISVESQCVQASAYFFYITHGIFISDPPIIFLGVASLLQSLVLIGQYTYYSRIQKEEKNGEDLEEGKSESDKDAVGAADEEDHVAILGTNNL